MTRAYRKTIKCHNCGTIIPVPHENPFLDWVRQQADLDASKAGLTIHDIDAVAHLYRVTDKSNGTALARQHCMLIEVKRNDEELTDAQRDIYKLLNQVLCDSDRKEVDAWRRGRIRFFYHGAHLLRIHGEKIDDARLQWDKKMITIGTLKNLLLFKIDAYTLKEREDRSHHKVHPLLIKDWCER